MVLVDQGLSHGPAAAMSMLIAFGLTLVAGQGCKPAASKFQNKPKVEVSASKSHEKYQDLVDSGDYEDFVDNLGEEDLIEAYDTAKDESDNETLVIGSYTFDSISDKLFEREEDYLSIADLVPSREEYWELLGFDPYETIDAEMFEQGLAAMERSFALVDQDYDDTESLLTHEESIAVERALLVLAAGGLSETGLALAAAPAPAAGTTQAATAVSMAVTGRLGMGDFEGVQCYQLGKYSAAEKIGGKYVAGIDGDSLGTTHDATGANKGGAGCGTVYRVTNTVTGDAEDFVAADRIWQNDGKGGCTYKDKKSADAKDPKGCTGKGYSQIDISKAAFQSLFNSQNPAPGSYTVERLP